MFELLVASSLEGATRCKISTAEVPALTTRTVMAKTETIKFLSKPFSSGPMSTNIYPL